MTSELVDELLICLERHQTEVGVALALEHLDQGGTVGSVVGALAAAQSEVGARWERDEWTVAQEHAATSTADRILAAVAAAIDEPIMYPTVLVVCAEGEWHTLPARMLTDLLRSLRWDARFLGGSIPTEHLRHYLEDEQPFAVVVHCSVAMSLPGVVGAVAAAHDASVPVLAGGRAFGDRPRRAAALGADAWAPDLFAAEALLHQWADDGVALAPSVAPGRIAAHARLLARRQTVVDLASDTLLEVSPYLRSATAEQRRRTSEDLTYLAAFVEAALLADDLTVLEEYVDWSVGVLVSRGVQRDVVWPAYEAVAGALHALGETEASNLVAAALAAAT